MIWTPEMDAIALKLKSDGSTALEIAKRLGGGLTRNAVLGRFNRLGGYSNSTPIYWTPEMDAQLRELWPQPLSAGQMGKRLGGLNHIVVGRRAKALGLPSKMTEWRRRCDRKSERGPRQTVQPGGLRDLPPDSSLFAIPFDRAELGQCRWPLGEPAYDMPICGAPCVNGFSWCERHCLRTFKYQRGG